MPLSVQAKTSLIGAGLGVSLILVLAAYFRRRGRRKTYRNLSTEPAHDEVDKTLIKERTPIQKSASPQTKSNGALPHTLPAGMRRNRSRALSERSNSFESCKEEEDNDDLISNSTITVVEADQLNPRQLCDAGLEELDMALAHWDTALKKIENGNDGEWPQDSELRGQLQDLLARGRNLKENFQCNLFRDVSNAVAIDAAIEEMDKEYKISAAHRQRSLRSMSSVQSDSEDNDSFVSALDVADLSDLQSEMVSTPQHLVLYDAALLELQHGSILYRVLRTNMVNCANDTEFLAKLHCIRMGYHEMFKDPTIREWFAKCGREMISDLLIKAERDPEDFQIAYDEMIEYVKDDKNWPEIEEELHCRGVKLMTFFDMVIDFILFDAFDDLEAPPSSVISVCQNRWLSNGFKETALSTAVWSVLKAKRRLLRFPNGFISHFYVISEHVSPVLAWGFLGPEGPLRDLCYFFKDQVVGYMQEVFSFKNVRYTTVEQLSDDLLRITRKHVQIASARLSSGSGVTFNF